MFEPHYDVVYGSAIFDWTRPVLDRLVDSYPDAIVGGTGSGEWRVVESITGENYEHFDYSGYPDYLYSVGFTQRGCRLKCPFCVVPQKEGKPVSVNTIAGLWREGTPRAVNLLDNDFFGVPVWKDRIAELVNGEFRVAFSQGINIRMVTDEVAKAIASLEYRDDGFQRRRLYTAWDNLGDEKRFFTGLERLVAAGVKARHVMVYMLVGFKEDETMGEVMYRYNRLLEAGCMPYPMVFERWRQPELRKFARWVIRRYNEFVPWADFQKRIDKYPEQAEFQWEDV